MKISYNPEDKTFSLLDPENKTKQFGYLDENTIKYVCYAAVRKGDRWEYVECSEVEDPEDYKNYLNRSYDEVKYFFHILEEYSVRNKKIQIQDFVDSKNGDERDRSEFKYWR